MKLFVANKTDLDPDVKIIEDLRKKLQQEIHPISEATGSGIKQLTEYVRQKVRKLK